MAWQNTGKLNRISGENLSDPFPQEMTSKDVRQCHTVFVRAKSKFHWFFVLLSDLRQEPISVISGAASDRTCLLYVSSFCLWSNAVSLQRFEGLTVDNPSTLTAKVCNSVMGGVLHVKIKLEMKGSTCALCVIHLFLLQGRAQTDQQFYLFFLLLLQLLFFLVVLMTLLHKLLSLFSILFPVLLLVLLPSCLAVTDCLGCSSFQVCLVGLSVPFVLSFNMVLGQCHRVHACRFSLWKESLKLWLKLRLKLWVQNCEKVPVKNFLEAEHDWKCFGTVSGRFSNFSFHFSQGTGGILFREHCFGRENSLNSAANSVSLRKNRWVRFGTQLIGWEELTEFSPWNLLRAKKLAEFGVWNRTLWKRIRPV